MNVNRGDERHVFAKAPRESATFAKQISLTKAMRGMFLRKLHARAQLLPKRFLSSKHRDPINWRKLRTRTQFRLFSDTAAAQRATAHPHRQEATGNTGHQPRRAGGRRRTTFVPAIFLRKLRTGAPKGPKVATARRRHARSVSALRRVVGVIINR